MVFRMKLFFRQRNYLIMPPNRRRQIAAAESGKCKRLIRDTDYHAYLSALHCIICPREPIRRSIFFDDPPYYLHGKTMEIINQTDLNF